MVDDKIIEKFILTVIITISLFLLYLKYCEEDRNITEIKHRISVIFPEITNMYIYVGDESTTISKRDIYLDIYKKDGTPYDLNTMVYVCLHEISHTICTVDDITSKHSKEFYAVFDKLLHKAIKYKVFNATIPLDPDYM